MIHLPIPCIIYFFCLTLKSPPALKWGITVLYRVEIWQAAMQKCSWNARGISEQFVKSDIRYLSKSFEVVLFETETVPARLQAIAYRAKIGSLFNKKEGFFTTRSQESSKSWDMEIWLLDSTAIWRAFRQPMSNLRVIRSFEHPVLWLRNSGSAGFF